MAQHPEDVLLSLEAAAHPLRPCGRFPSSSVPRYGLPMANEQAWMVWAGPKTQGFRTKTEAERWAQVIKAFSPRGAVAIQRVRKP